VAVLSAASVTSLPAPKPVDHVQVEWLDGPRAAQREVDGWLASFPYREQLAEANTWVMGKLSEHLLAQPGVGEVRRVELRHAPIVDKGVAHLGRILVVELGMRRPYMPAALANGARVWVDRDGVVLPGTLRGPDKRRPLLVGIEQGSVNLRNAVEMWQRLEPNLDPYLVSSISCNEPLDAYGTRGIVLNARGGSKLVWGRSDENRYGRDAEAKARDLIHTIRCQGDLARVATINVRFAKPFYTLK
jgi:hypothetical protein